MNMRSLQIVLISALSFIGLMILIEYAVASTTTFDSEGILIQASPLTPLLHLVTLGSMLFTGASGIVVAYLLGRAFYKNTVGATSSGKGVDIGWDAMPSSDKTKWAIGVITALACALIVSSRADELPVSQDGIDLIVHYEVGGEQYYKQKLIRPTVPAWRTTASGVTVGFGYDCGYNTRSQIHKDWTGILPTKQVQLLQTVAGLKGSQAYYAHKRIKYSVHVPYLSAEKVFINKSLPRFSKLTASAFDIGPNRLHPDCNGALVATVYNRGGSMRNTYKRREMRWIKYNIAVGREDRVPSDFLVMRQQWSATKLRGLHLRYAATSKLFAQGIAKRESVSR